MPNYYRDVLPDGVNSLTKGGISGGEILEIKLFGLIGAGSAITDIYPYGYSSTSIDGVGAEFTVTQDVSDGAPTVAIASPGRGYKAGDQITIAQSAGDGWTGSLTIEVLSVTTADPAVGFKAITLSSNEAIMRNKTNSGKLITRAAAYHFFEIGISYNKMTKAEFNKIFAFLARRQGGLKPFFVELPQYVGGVDRKVGSALGAGVNQLTIANTDYFGDALTDPELGDVFTFYDPDNTNHCKSYLITNVESTLEEGDPAADSYGGAAVVAGTVRITFIPSLAASVGSSASVNLECPKLKVVNKTNKMKYTLDTENLYKFKLGLEEVQT